MNDLMMAFSELTSTDLTGLDRERQLVVWPIASLEQHGPHLPLGTDAIVLRALIENVRQRLGAGFPGILLPALELGKSPEHLAFAGTVSLRATTLIAIMEDVVSSLARHGFRHFAFLNGHGGNTALLQSMAFDLQERFNVKVYNIDLWGSSFFDPVISDVFPDLAGTEVHAGSVETAMLLYLCPNLVKTAPKIEAPTSFASRLASGWAAQEFHPSGVIGDPSKASVESGARFFDYAIQRVSDILLSIATDMAGQFH